MYKWEIYCPPDLQNLFWAGPAAPSRVLYYQPRTQKKKAEVVTPGVLPTQIQTPEERMFEEVRVTEQKLKKEKKKGNV